MASRSSETVLPDSSSSPPSYDRIKNLYLALRLEVQKGVAPHRR